MVNEEVSNDEGKHEDDAVISYFKRAKPEQGGIYVVIEHFKGIIMAFTNKGF